MDNDHIVLALTERLFANFADVQNIPNAKDRTWKRSSGRLERRLFRSVREAALLSDPDTPGFYAFNDMLEHNHSLALKLTIQVHH